MIKESQEKFKKQFAWLGENTEKYITFAVSARIDRNGKEVSKHICYNLLITQDLWQTHYQILSILKGNSHS